MKRNYGIDLLRIVSMIFVILLHIMGVGGVCANTQLFSPQFFLSQFVRIATFCAVNCYALISGFVGWDRRPKPSGLLNLWAKVILFCVAITVFTQLRAPEAVGLGDLWKAFTPVKEAKYWYFNAYVGLFFFLPLLNHGVRGISGRDAVFVMAGIFLVVLNVPNSKISQVFLLANGYSTLWLMILYILGGLMGRFDIPGKLSARGWLCLYLLAVLGSFDAGVRGDYTTIFAKSALDFMMAMTFAATMGVGVLFSGLTILVYQGALTLLAGVIEPYLSREMLTEMNAVGGVMLIATGMNVMGLHKERIQVGNMLPALLVPVVWFWLRQLLG